MTDFFHAIRQIFEGTRKINERAKYQMIEAVLGVIHLVFALVFFRYKLTPLAIYNVLIVLYYAAMAILIVKIKNYAGILVSTCAEIIIHSTVVTLLLGFDWGFMIYIIALIPAIFYVGLTLDFFEQNVIASTISSLVVTVVYLATRILSDVADPLYTGFADPHAKTFMYYFNPILALVMLWSTAVLYALEIRYMRRKLESEKNNLSDAANYDPLTKLFNRRGINEHMRRAIENAEKLNEPFSIIMADIDNFKDFNDSYGHALGDVVLMKVADVFRECVREDDSVCRWGGEEIVVLIHADMDVAETVAQRIRTSLTECPIPHEEEKLHVTMTFGVASYQPGLTLRTIVDIADDRLYYGKLHGKDQVVAYVTHMTEELSQRRDHGKNSFGL